MDRYICVHGHFYQPPRENPWLEEVELQDSAYPYHDWNERITAECYAPNAAARILVDHREIREIINNYSKISFNFGPTLLAWIERQAPEVYRAIIDADRESRQRFSGHGSAIAQVYNHLIMPLANRRDKQTQVIWGIADFERRFGRRPEGMWLAETAVDTETLEVLVEHGIVFTILAQHQAQRARPMGGKKWRDVSGGGIDPKLSYLCRLPSGASIVLFFYDGPISQDMAFAGLLMNGEAMAHRWLSAFTDDPNPQLVHLATDGETYGHHHRYGEMALAYALRHVEENRLAQLTIYGEYLEKVPPANEVQIIENSSWSCVHGIERWRSNCGCNSGRSGWQQEWRMPLREALDDLRDRLAGIYEAGMADLAVDPWTARNDYISVILDRSPENVERFLAEHARRELPTEEKVKMLRLLEMQRHAMLMYTSCGWFFDEISGLETTQVMQYAARAMQLAERACGVSLEPGLLAILHRAPSNLPEYANGAQTYEKLVKPATIDLLRLGAHYAVSSLFEDYEENQGIFCYTAQREILERHVAGRQKLAIGRARLCSSITWSENEISFAVLHLGEHNLIGGVRSYQGDEDFGEMQREILEAFGRGDLPEIIHMMDRHFETHSYSLRHLFRDQQRKIFNRVLEDTMEEVENSFRQIYEHNYQAMQAMHEMGIPLPEALAIPAEYIINVRLRRLLESDVLDLNQLSALVEEIRKWSFDGERYTVGYAASRKISDLMEKLEQTPAELDLLRTIERILRLLDMPSIELDLMKAQNLHFRIARKHYSDFRVQAESGNEQAKEWIKHFDLLGTFLQIGSA